MMNLQTTFQIQLKRSDEFEVRRKYFLERFYAIEDHNAGNSSYELGINEFSHYSEEELLRFKTGYIHTEAEDSVELPVNPIRINTQSYFDWRDHPSVVRPVQNQKSCGSCWAFAAIGALEGQMTLKNRRNDKLSEQEVTECLESGGCNGGWDHWAYKHAKDHNGVTSALKNPYVAFTNGRACNVRHPRVLGSSVTGWFVSPRDEESVRNTLQYGPLFIVFHVSNDFYNYRSGIYQDSRNLCRNQYVNHAVLLVGYGSEKGVDYWTLKNSWGA